MKVFNPTKDKISVQIMGRQYVIESGETLKNVPEIHAMYWKNSLHDFIVISDESSVDVKKEVEEIMAESSEEIVDEVKEEVKEEKPKNKSNKK